MSFKGFGDQLHILDAKLEMFEKAQDLWGTLIHEGFEVPKSKNKPLVLQYLKSVISDLKITSVSKMGWITDNQFICPSFCVTKEKMDKQFLLDSNVTNLGFEKKGDLKGWQDNVCRYAKNNDMLILSSCASFAGSLLKFINQPCVAVNFVGKSSTGKTTNLIFASSTCGNPQQYKK